MLGVFPSPRELVGVFATLTSSSLRGPCAGPWEEEQTRGMEAPGGLAPSRSSHPPWGPGGRADFINVSPAPVLMFCRRRLAILRTRGSAFSFRPGSYKRCSWSCPVA